MKGRIHPAAAQVLHGRHREHQVLSPFVEAGFDVTWANQRRQFNTELMIFLLKPDQGLQETYGFEYEVMLAYSKYDKIEPRTIGAAEQVLEMDPLRGRAEPMMYFLASEAQGSASWVSSYQLEHRESRIVVPCDIDGGFSNRGAVAVHSALASHYFKLDRFRHMLPLREDTYFFARSAELARLVDRMRRGENAGLFGLRKTGKTSVILKLERLLRDDAALSLLNVDAQEPKVRRRRWYQLLQWIAKQLNGEDAPGEFTDLDAGEDFERAVARHLANCGRKRLVLIVDEVEWLSPGTCRDEHWNEDFLELWQSLRAIQTRTGNLSVLLAGVNPSIIEVDRFGRFQNPLFGIVTSEYLAGLSLDDVRELVGKIGKVMGLRFAEEAVRELHDEYGGHPLLTRLACSNVAELAKSRKDRFPIAVGVRTLNADQGMRDSDLVFYVRHVVSELEIFYPREYTILERLAEGDFEAFRNASTAGTDISHLHLYGIVARGEHPYITCDVVREYVASEAARRAGGSSPRPVVEATRRTEYLALRLRAVADDMRTLERNARLLGHPALFGVNSFPEADKLLLIKLVDGEADFAAAMNALNRCFVESIEVYGKSIPQSNYFWVEIKKSYPALFDSLHRIKVYRHNAHHLVLTDKVERSLRDFLEKDLAGHDVVGKERFWLLFQITIDELMRALQLENSKY
jgi:hypothetical protein